ncbi:MAG: diaminohydroxyphosphoribosylaminopyrimidine deaminase [Parvicellaceae bacterium]|jgi:diaminohydroxyphosphoribosylaminopyrimidine deaminase/5-amino-6-(5-phosphoribosylamino)uracil reductase
MPDHVKYMHRCLELASEGLRGAMPNPGVGAVLVVDDKIIAEGYTQRYGFNHAEVEAINNVKDRNLFSKATLYVSLEPCAHFGKTPPCADLIVEKGIKKVVVGCKDPFQQVDGKGIERLEKNGISVNMGVLEQECLELNKRFFTFHLKNRPYITLKWAQTKDGFIDRDRTTDETGINWITSKETKAITHQWRTEESAILIGTNTAINDDPSLTARAFKGENPTRIVIDRKGVLDENLALFNGEVKTLVLAESASVAKPNSQTLVIDFNNFITSFNQAMVEQNLLSVMVEGGAKLLQTFIDGKNWDEAKVLTGNVMFENGLNAPDINRAGNPRSERIEQANHDMIQFYYA